MPCNHHYFILIFMFRFQSDEELVDFFEDDRCCKIADKYLIAMVFTYFLRAALRPEEYTRSNFFIAL